LETGDADSKTVRQLVPAAKVLPALLSFSEPVAPLLAARNVRRQIPSAKEIAGQRPRTDNSLLIETFGSPFSPLNDVELQIALVKELACRSLLVSSSALGAIGRTIQCLLALGRHSVTPDAVVLLGARDDFAVEQIGRHQPGIPVFSL